MAAPFIDEKVIIFIERLLRDDKTLTANERRAAISVIEKCISLNKQEKSQLATRLRELIIENKNDNLIAGPFLLAIVVRTRAEAALSDQDFLVLFSQYEQHAKGVASIEAEKKSLEEILPQFAQIFCFAALSRYKPILQALSKESVLIEKLSERAEKSSKIIQYVEKNAEQQSTLFNHKKPSAAAFCIFVIRLYVDVNLKPQHRP